jgi:hypothetical protein
MSTLQTSWTIEQTRTPHTKLPTPLNRSIEYLHTNQTKKEKEIPIDDSETDKEYGQI